VNWTEYRAAFEREASAYFGRPVTIAGKAGLRLLPTPVVTFTDISIGEGAAPDVHMERFRAEVELTPLLSGDVRVVSMIVERPRFTIVLAAVGGAEAASEQRWRVEPEHISLGSLEIIEGSALVRDSRVGRSWRAENIDAMVEAASLIGPGRVEAALEMNGTPMDLSVAFGRLSAADTVTTKISLSSPLYPVTLSTDGVFAFGAEEPPRYSGTATLAGIEADDEEEARSPWADFRATGAFELTSAELAIDQAQISYGAMERPLVLEAAGRLTLDADPEFDALIRARQIDIDRALGGSAESPVPVETALRTLLARLPELPQAPLRGSLRLEAQGLVLGGSVVEGVTAQLDTAADGWNVKSLAATLPGETRLDLAGSLRLAPAPVFEGDAGLASARPPALASWLGGDVGSAGALESFGIEAKLALDSERQTLSDLVIATGEGTVRGSLELRRFTQSDQLFVNAAFSADRIDLAEMRALRDLLPGGADLGSEIDQMTFSLDADTVVLRGIEARSVLVNGGFESGRFELRQLAVADLAGASIEASGSIADPLGSPGGRLEASVTAEDLSGAAEFLAALAPENPALAHFRRIAPALSPVQADVSAVAGPEGTPLSLDVTGSFADTHLSVAAKGQGSLAEPGSLSGELRLKVEGEDSAEALTQLGLLPLPVPAGPVSIDAAFQGMLASAGTLEAQGTIAGINFRYTAETAVADGAVALVGAVEAESFDVDPALLMAGFAAPGLGEGHAVAARGSLEVNAGRLNLTLDEASFAGQKVGGAIEASFGPSLSLAGRLDLEHLSLPALAALSIGGTPAFQNGWSDAAVAPAVPRGLALAFDVNATEVDLGLPIAAKEVSLRFELSEARLDVDVAQARFAHGALEGSIAATLRDGTADVAIRAALEGATLEALVWEHGGLPVASGLLDGTVQVTGSGRSMAGVVASLAGSGSFAIRQGRFNTLNPAALATVMEAAEGAEEPNEEQARETFAIHFGSGALPFGQVAGSFAVVAGIVEMATVSIDTNEATILAEASFDLNTLTLASDWVVRAGGDAAAETAQPHVGMLFSGPIANPERQTDLAPLLDLLRSRYMQRQLDELEALEQERRRGEADRAARETPGRPAEAQPGVSSAGTAPPPVGEPMHTPALGAPSGGDPPASTGSIEPPPPPGTAAPDEEPGREAREAELREMLERIAPAVRDMISGSAAAAEAPRPGARELPSTAPAAAVAPQAAPVKQRARTSPRRARADPQPARSSPPARTGAAAATETSRPAEPGQAAPPEEDAYNTLPNGVILKVR
jgi:hypothetical protein